MEELLPGDIVEFLDDSTRGKVVSVISKSELMIELEEGLEIPVAKSQLILVEKSLENLGSQKDSIVGAQKKKLLPHTDRGVFIGLEYEESSSRLSFNILNDTQDFIYYTLYSKQNGQIAGLSKGNCPAYSFSMNYNIWLHDSDHLPGYILQIIRFTVSPATLPSPVSFSFKISQKKLLTNLENAPLLDKPMYLIPVVNEALSKATVGRDLPIAGMPIPEKEVRVEMSPPPEVVDLHIQNLQQKYEIMSRAEIFDYQFSYFVNNLEKARALNYPKIIFIHGIGAGVLKSRIVTYLKQHRDTLRFQDADVKKFGYGATEVIFKKQS